MFLYTPSLTLLRAAEEDLVGGEIRPAVGRLVKSKSRYNMSF